MYVCTQRDECVCHQVPDPSCPLSTATSQSPGCLQSWRHASALLVQPGSDFPFLLLVWKDQNPRARQGDLLLTILSSAKPGLAFLQQPCPTSPARVSGSFEQGLVTSCKAESWHVRQGCCRLSMGYGICRWGGPEFLLRCLQDSWITRQSLGEQNKAGPSCSLLLLPSGGVERHHRRILKGEAQTGDGEGAVASRSGGGDFFLHLPQISQLILSGLGNSRVTRMWGRYNHKPRVF